MIIKHMMHTMYFYWPAVMLVTLFERMYV